MKETHCCKTVHLAVFLSFSFTHTLQVCSYGMLQTETPAHLTTNFDHTLFAFYCTIFNSCTIHSVAPALTHTNTDLVPTGMFTSWRLQNRPTAVNEIRALSLLLSLNTHTVYIR